MYGPGSPAWKRKHEERDGIKTPAAVANPESQRKVHVLNQSKTCKADAATERVCTRHADDQNIDHANGQLAAVAYKDARDGGAVACRWTVLSSPPPPPLATLSTRLFSGMQITDICAERSPHCEHLSQGSLPPRPYSGFLASWDTRAARTDLFSVDASFRYAPQREIKGATRTGVGYQDRETRRDEREWPRGGAKGAIISALGGERARALRRLAIRRAERASRPV